MEKSLEGYLFHRIEKLGDKDYEHVGFEDEEKKFGEMITELVPEVGGRRKVKITLTTLED